MILQEYHRKRKFSETPEPAGAKKEVSTQRRFVVQKHEASRLHYDFRLETEDGVLKSWAVPKGISMDPGVKRLAVLTEDHPLDYLLFEGIIPKGNYGAGTVVVWDTGKYSSPHDIASQFKKGKISFNLEGEKLRGKFSLVKTSRENQWLLIKANDEYASSIDLTVTKPESVLTSRTNMEVEEGKPGYNPKTVDDFPTAIRPMLATPVDLPFDSKEWVFEIKWDGVRSVLFLSKPKGILALQSRSGKSITHRYPEIVESAKSDIRCKQSVILDGEIVVLDKEGLPDFQSHQKRMNVDYGKEIRILSEKLPATYYVFDILYLDGKNLQGLEFTERRKILSQVISGKKRIRISEYFEDYGKDLFERAENLGLEGIIAKRKSSRYLQGTRSSDWLKIKSIKTQDCVVIGYTKGEGSRKSHFGSLILAVNEAGKLRFVGHTGSGFNFDQLEKTLPKLEQLKMSEPPVENIPYTNREPVWIRPQLVVEIKFNGWTNEKIMRAPIFVRFREDKLPQDCTVEEEKNLQEIVTVAQAKKKSDFSNLHKVFWPETTQRPALTKKDLIEYYEKVSSFILPYLRDRPLSLSRYPDGITGKSFYHKNWNQAKPAYVQTVKVYSRTREGIINYIVCNNKNTLLWVANLGCIEMHPWYSRVDNFNACKDKVDEDKCGLGFPDFVVFDLDPYIYSGKEEKGGEPEYNVKGFKAAVEVAFGLKDLLDELKIDSYIKTSGKTGLHIYIPIVRSYDYDQTREFAEIIGKILSRRHPEKITMSWNAEQRYGKVFFDHNQNARGKTLASVYSARPTLTATASLPVRWDKLDSVLPTDFTMLNVPEMLQKTADPWKNILKKKQDLGKIMKEVTEIK